MIITATAHTIVLVARHAANEPPPPHLAAAVASIAAILDAAGITYTAREFTAAVTYPPLRRQPARRKAARAAAAITKALRS